VRGHGRRYLIERGPTWAAELEAIVIDYLPQPPVWNSIPAAGVCCWLSDLAEQGR
jgi:hypothetical protein